MKLLKTITYNYDDGDDGSELFPLPPSQFLDAKTGEMFLQRGADGRFPCVNTSVELSRS